MSDIEFEDASDAWPEPEVLQKVVGGISAARCF
jgi:hypothetical protein